MRASASSCWDLSLTLRPAICSAEMFCRLGEAELLAGHPAEAADAAGRALALQPQHQPSRDLLERIELAQQPRGTVR